MYVFLSANGPAVIPFSTYYLHLLVIPRRIKEVACIAELHGGHSCVFGIGYSDIIMEERVAL